MKLDATTMLQHAMFATLATAYAADLSKLRDDALLASGHKSGAKLENEAARDAGGTIWTGILNIAEATANAQDADKLDAEQLNGVFAALVSEQFQPRNAESTDRAALEAAAKTVKTYVSTAKNTLKQVKAGKLNWHQCRTRLIAVKEGEAPREEAVSHDDVRDMLKSGAQKEIDAMREKAAKMVSKIAGRENDVRNAGTRRKQLADVLVLLEPFYTAAVKASEDDKPKNKLAQAVNSAAAGHNIVGAVVEVETGATVEATQRPAQEARSA